MKFNLKNRPKTLFAESSFAKWFEGFEKELREKLKRNRLTSHGYCPVWDNAYDFALREILGE